MAKKVKENKKLTADFENHGIFPENQTEGKGCEAADNAKNVSGNRDEDKAFEELVTRYGHIIRSVSATLSVPESEREDLYQEGLIALHRAMCNYDESIAKFSTFASVCIRRAMLTWIRNHVSRLDKDGNAVREISIDDAFLADLPEDADTPEELYITKESVAALKKKALMCLSDYEKCVFLMYLDNMSASEIGEALGKDKKSVENALGRIRTKISRGVASSER